MNYNGILTYTTSYFNVSGLITEYFTRKKNGLWCLEIHKRSFELIPNVKQPKSIDFFCVCIFLRRDLKVCAKFMVRVTVFLILSILLFHSSSVARSVSHVFFLLHNITIPGI